MVDLVNDQNRKVAFNGTGVCTIGGYNIVSINGEYPQMEISVSLKHSVNFEEHVQKKKIKIGKD